MQKRSDFLAAGTAAILGSSLAAPGDAATPFPAPTTAAFRFDLAAFDSMLEAATHRHAFGATKLAGGLVLEQMRSLLIGYGVVGAPTAKIQPVAVLYHGASIMLAFGDAMWNQFFIPLQAKPSQHTAELLKDTATVIKRGASGNPLLRKNVKKDDASIASLVSDSAARFLVCNRAVEGFSALIAGELKLHADDVYAELSAHLIPNAMLVPTGVWAVHAVQERRYTYLQSTL
jgi:hypothetical protein